MKGGRKNSGRKNEPEQWPALSDDWDTERGKASHDQGLQALQKFGPFYLPLWNQLAARSINGQTQEQRY
jgi:hypothetical protein